MFSWSCIKKILSFDQFPTPRVGIVIYLFVWFWVALTTVNLDMKVHWLVFHSRLSEKLAREAGENYVPGQEKVVVEGDAKQNRLVLWNQAAMKVVFDDDKMETVFIAN